MPDASALNTVYRRLMVAAVGEVDFADAVRAMVTAFGGAAGVAFEFDRANTVFRNWVGDGLQDGEDEYRAHINRINPRMRYSLRHAPGHILYEAKYIDQRGIDRHEFYDWLGRYDMRYFLGSRVFDEGDVSLFTSVEFTLRHGHPDQAKIDAFQRMAPVVGQAWRLCKRAAPGSGAAGPWTPDHLPWAIFAVDTAGRVVEMNRRARALVAGQAVLGLDAGRLVALDRQFHERFRQALRRGLAGSAAETALLPAVGRVPILVQILPTNPGQLRTPSVVAAVVYIWDPRGSTADRGRVLARIYGFSPAECRLAEAMARGGTLDEAAGQLGIVRNTARNHLQSMFAKTGTRRQADFLLHIIGILDAPSPPPPLDR